MRHRNPLVLRVLLPFLIVVSVLRVAGASAATAPDAHAESKVAAQKAAETWLAGVDRGQYGESWDGAAGLFQKAGPRADWIATLEQGRRPLGAVRSRAFTAADYATSLPGAPAGEYVALRFSTVFEKKGGFEEKLVATFEGGRWRILGYRVVPAGLPPAQVEAAKKDAQKVAEGWLAILDQGSYGEAWDRSSALSQKAGPRAGFVTTLQQVRQPLGPVRSRALRSASYETTLPGIPDGDYVVLQYDTTYTTRGASVETVTLTLEGGVWKPAGYFIQ
jgi:Protein of unknown function (DUF4019)